MAGGVHPGCGGEWAEAEVIPPGTPVSVYEAYDIMMRVKGIGDILLPLHEPSFAFRETIP